MGTFTHNEQAGLHSDTFSRISYILGTFRHSYVPPAHSKIESRWRLVTLQFSHVLPAREIIAVSKIRFENFSSHYFSLVTPLILRVFQ